MIIKDIHDNEGNEKFCSVFSISEELRIFADTYTYRQGYDNFRDEIAHKNVLWNTQKNGKFYKTGDLENQEIFGNKILPHFGKIKNIKPSLKERLLEGVRSKDNHDEAFWNPKKKILSASVRMDDKDLVEDWIKKHGGEGRSKDFALFVSENNKSAKDAYREFLRADRDHLLNPYTHADKESKELVKEAIRKGERIKNIKKGALITAGTAAAYGGYKLYKKHESKNNNKDK